MHQKVPLIGSYPDRVFSKYDPHHLVLLESIIIDACETHGTEAIKIWDQIMEGMKQAKMAVTSTAFIFDRLWDHIGQSFARDSSNDGSQPAEQQGESGHLVQK